MMILKGLNAIKFANSYFHPSIEYIKSTKKYVEFINNNIELHETTNGFVATIKQLKIDKN